MSNNLFNHATAIINALNARRSPWDPITLRVLKNSTYNTPAHITLTLSWLPEGKALDLLKEEIIDIVGTHEITWTPNLSGSLDFGFSL